MINALLPAALYTHHMPQGDGSGPSGQIIGTIVGAATNPDGSQRLHSGMDEDFDAQIDPSTGTAGVLDGTRLSYFKDTLGTIITSDTDLGGVVDCDTGAAVGDEEITMKGVAGAVLDGTKVNPDAGLPNQPATLPVDNPVFFEARLTTDQTNASSYFVGVVAAGTAAADEVIADSGSALVDTDAMGFLIKDNGEISFVMRKTGEAETELIGTGVLGSAVDGAWLSLGFIYSRRPLSSSHEKLQVYKDNVSVGNVQGIVLTDALTPKDVVMAPIITAKSQAQAAFKVDFGYCHTLMD